MVVSQLQQRPGFALDILNSGSYGLPLAMDGQLACKSFDPAPAALVAAGSAGVGVCFNNMMPQHPEEFLPLLDEKDSRVLELPDDNGQDLTSGFLNLLPQAPPATSAVAVSGPAFPQPFFCANTALNNVGAQWNICSDPSNSAVNSTSNFVPATGTLSHRTPATAPTSTTSSYPPPVVTTSCKADSDLSSGADDDGAPCSALRPKTSGNDPPASEEDMSRESWFITLKSAGVRIKGRSREELIAVADRIRKRRRESAARSRARKANRVCTLGDENEALRRENESLRRQIAELELQLL